MFKIAWSEWRWAYCSVHYTSRPGAVASLDAHFVSSRSQTTDSTELGMGYLTCTIVGLVSSPQLARAPAQAPRATFRPSSEKVDFFVGVHTAAIDKRRREKRRQAEARRGERDCYPISYPFKVHTIFSQVLRFRDRLALESYASRGTDADIHWLRLTPTPLT